MTTGRINQVAVFGNETCNTSSSPVEGGFRKQISLLRTTPSQRRRSLFFTSPFPVTCIDTHSEPFRLSKLSPLSQTRTHADCSIGAVVELVLLGHQWPPGSVSGPQYLLEERELASLKIPHSSSSLSKADRKTGCDPVITCSRKSFPNRLDRSKDPSQGNRVFDKTSSRARHTLRFGY